MCNVKVTTNDELIDIDGNVVQETEWFLHTLDLQYYIG